MHSNYLTTDEAAMILGHCRSTLEKWRHLGGGPKFYKIGKRSIRYKIDDLTTFAESPGPKGNTAQ